MSAMYAALSFLLRSLYSPFGKTHPEEQLKAPYLGPYEHVEVKVFLC